MDKAVDQNDTYSRTMELVESYERDALLNETKADQLEVEADRLRNVAKEKRAEAKKQKTFAEDLTSKSKRTKEKNAHQEEANDREKAALADDARGSIPPKVEKKDGK